jgi:hypothetical protein
VKKTVSKFAFQVHNLQRYNAVVTVRVIAENEAGRSAPAELSFTVGLCTLESS